MFKKILVAVDGSTYAAEVLPSASNVTTHERMRRTCW
jgi:hypothetical protein